MQLVATDSEQPFIGDQVASSRRERGLSQHEYQGTRTDWPMVIIANAAAPRD